MLCSLIEKLDIAQEKKTLIDTQADATEKRLSKLREDVNKLRADKSMTEEALLSAKLRLKG